MSCLSSRKVSRAVENLAEKHTALVTMATRQALCLGVAFPCLYIVYFYIMFMNDIKGRVRIPRYVLTVFNLCI